MIGRERRERRVKTAAHTGTVCGRTSRICVDGFNNPIPVWPNLQRPGIGLGQSRKLRKAVSVLRTAGGDNVEVADIKCFVQNAKCEKAASGVKALLDKCRRDYEDCNDTAEAYRYGMSVQILPSITMSAQIKPASTTTMKKGGSPHFSIPMLFRARRQLLPSRHAASWSALQNHHRGPVQRSVRTRTRMISRHESG
jgi:hypothetical protein